ncbi:MAG: PEP-utilizing enzyme [Candidatus Limnocylindria bacterium]
MATSLRGTPASPGRATGRARIVRSTAEFDRVQAGEILVCPVTTPAWTPLFARIAAVVTDVGSIAAHASIIAREYGIPAVVATGDGTTRIADGSLITVDGGAGLVLRAD